MFLQHLDFVLRLLISRPSINNFEENFKQDVVVIFNIMDLAQGIKLSETTFRIYTNCSVRTRRRRQYLENYLRMRKGGQLFWCVGCFCDVKGSGIIHISRFLIDFHRFGALSHYESYDSAGQKSCCKNR